MTSRVAVISETIKAAILGLCILEIPAKCKLASSMCHAHFNAHKPPKTVSPTVLMLELV